MRATTGVYYFDLLGGAVAAVIGARLLAVALDPTWRWDAMRLVTVAAFLVTLAAMITLRSHVYRQETPWLVFSFSAAAGLTLIVLFWPLHVVWFALMLVAGLSALAVGLVMRTRRVSEPISRNDVFQLAALAVGVVLAVASLEVALRLAPGILSAEVRQIVAADAGQYGVPHPYIGHLHRPNGITTVAGKGFSAVHKVDGKGFRNSSPWPAKADVVVIGDSVTFGYGATGEQAWPAILSRNLPNTTLVNLALIGAGPQQYFRVYETFGIELRPRLLIVGVFAGNDFWDAETFDLWLKSGAAGNFIVWRDFGRPGPVTFSLTDPKETLMGGFNRYIYPVMRASRVYNLLRAFHRGLDGDFGGPPVYVNFGDGSRVRLLPGDFRSKSAMGASNSHAFRLALDAFTRIHSLAAMNGTRVLMVLQPSKEEVYLPLLEANLPDPTRALREAFDERGIEYLDLAPDFRKRAAAGGRLFYEDDGHPNPSGYALTAELVLSYLRSGGRPSDGGKDMLGTSTSTRASESRSGAPLGAAPNQ